MDRIIYTVLRFLVGLNPRQYVHFNSEDEFVFMHGYDLDDQIKILNALKEFKEAK